MPLEHCMAIGPFRGSEVVAVYLELAEEHLDIRSASMQCWGSSRGNEKETRRDESWSVMKSAIRALAPDFLSPTTSRAVNAPYLNSNLSSYPPSVIWTMNAESSICSFRGIYTILSSRVCWRRRRTRDAKPESRNNYLNARRSTRPSNTDHRSLRLVSRRVRLFPTYLTTTLARRMWAAPF